MLVGRLQDAKNGEMGIFSSKISPCIFINCKTSSDNSFRAAALQSELSALNNAQRFLRAIENSHLDDYLLCSLWWMRSLKHAQTEHCHKLFKRNKQRCWCHMHIVCCIALWSCFINITTITALELWMSMTQLVYLSIFQSDFWAMGWSSTSMGHIIRVNDCLVFGSQCK